MRAKSISAPRPVNTASGRAVRRMAAAAALLLLAAWIGTAAQAPSQPPIVDLPADASDPVRSFFISDPAFGKDPFFPKSARRVQQETTVPVAATTNILEQIWDPNFDLLAIKGISLAEDKKLVMINHYTFAEGEVQDVKVANQVISVRCESIAERSATIIINGRRKVLTLREGLH
jgi:hypothetical protein